MADLIKAHAQSTAINENVSYIYLNNSKTRKEKLIKSIIEDRGNHPGLIAVLSALEVDNSFDIYKNKETHKLELICRTTSVPILIE